MRVTSADLHRLTGYSLDALISKAEVDLSSSGLDDAAVERNSTLRNLPDKMPPMIIAYGGQEQIEFQRQSREFAETLQARGDDCQLFFYDNNKF